MKSWTVYEYYVGTVCGGARWTIGQKRGRREKYAAKLGLTPRLNRAAFFLSAAAAAARIKMVIAAALSFPSSFGQRRGIRQKRRILIRFTAWVENAFGESKGRHERKRREEKGFWKIGRRHGHKRSRGQKGGGRREEPFFGRGQTEANEKDNLSGILSPPPLPPTTKHKKGFPSSLRAHMLTTNERTNPQLRRSRHVIYIYIIKSLCLDPERREETRAHVFKSFSSVRQGGGEGKKKL